MLLEFKAENFCAFKDMFEFSMRPGKVVKRFENNVINPSSKIKVSKVGVIVGENAGGKTCFMNSLDFLKSLFESNLNIAAIPELCYSYKDTLPQKFVMVTLLNKKIYHYELVIDTQSIVCESLYVRGESSQNIKNDAVFTFNRNDLKKKPATPPSINGDIKINSSYVSSNIIKILEPKKSFAGNSLFINMLYTLDIDIVKPLVHWITQKLIVESPSDYSLNYLKRFMEDEKDIQILKNDKFIEVFSLVDSSIVNIQVDEQDPFKDTVIIRKRKDGTEFSIKIKDDSSGVNEFFAWAIQIWKVLYEDATLFADEFDKVLNPILASKVVSLLKGSEHKGQFVFTTHNIFHLNTIDFMKEQIYFVSKDPETLGSSMYSLGDFPDYRYEKTDVYDLYLKGILGGVPHV